MTRAAMSRLDDWELENDSQDIRGWPVYDRDNQPLGSVTDLIGDTDRGYIDTIVLNDRTELPTDTVRISDGMVVVTAGTTTATATDDETEMVRSREQLRVGTEQVTTGRMRLRKRVVTEKASTTVPVAHEEVRVEREAIPAGERGRYADRELGEEVAEVGLTAERPVVGKETVPVERVRAAKETVTENVPVTGTVREERIELDEDQR